jgi:lysophospholipase L1-like esterase
MFRAGLAALLLVAAVAQAEPPAVLLVGDSTMAPLSGYGDALCQRLEPALACVNLGRGGRSTSSYRAEGLWDGVLARLQARAPGTAAYVLIQFGHNDQPGKPGRSTDLATEYPANLARYVAEARASGAVPVLVTPLSRRSFKDGALVDDLQLWAQAMRQVAREQQVALADLYALSGATVRSLGSASADELARAAPGQPGFDRTHLGRRGACVFAEQLSIELAHLLPALSVPRSPTLECTSVPAPSP